MRTILIRLSHQRCGNTALTQCINQFCLEKNIGEVFHVIGREIHNSSAKWWKEVNINNFLNIIEKYNVSEFNLMDNIRFVNELKENYNINFYCLERKNKLKSALSGVIKFNKYDKEIISTKTSEQIINVIKRKEKVFESFKKHVNKENWFYYEDLYRDYQLNIPYFETIINTIGLTRNNETYDNMIYKEKNIIKDSRYYYEFIHEKILEEVQKETGYNLD